jgi:hypothetical protein
MDQKTPLNTFLDRVAQLPIDIRQGILEVDFLSALRKITDDNQLHIDQASALEETTFQLMIGDIEEKDYIQDLSQNMRVPVGRAESIADAVNQSIFEPIREAIERLQDEDESIDEVISEKEQGATGVENKSGTEDHNSLNADDILAGIENPTPSSTFTRTEVNTNSRVLSAPSSKDILDAMVDANKTNTQQAPVATQPVAIPPPTPASAPTVASTSLQNNLTQQVVSPTSTSIASIDPYKEPVE